MSISNSRFSFYVLLFIVTIILVFNSDSQAGEELKLGADDIAVIGGYAIKKNDFYRGIDLLHTSDKIGKALEGDKRSFDKADFQKYFDDMIANKLILIEADRLNLGDIESVKEELRLYEINLLLTELKEEEIKGKVKVTKGEVYDYYVEQKIKQELEKREQKKDSEGSKDSDDKNGSEEAELEDLYSDEYRVKTLKAMPSGDYRNIVEGFAKVKTAEREKEFFDSLKKKAKIKIYKKVITKLTEGDVGYADKTIAKIRGRKFTAREVWVMLPDKAWQDRSKVEAMVDQLILNEILDREASKRGYEKKPQVAEQLNRYREKVLNQVFKDNVINELIKVSAEEVEKYYNENRRMFKYIDELNLSVIKVSKSSDAETIIEELTEGADFAYLAKKMSLDVSRVNGGVLGWVPINKYPGADIINIKNAEKGSIAGPFMEGRFYIILELNGYREGKQVSLERVSKDIDLMLGREKVEPALNKYIEGLKKKTPALFNETELSLYSIKGY